MPLPFTVELDDERLTKLCMLGAWCGQTPEAFARHMVNRWSLMRSDDDDRPPVQGVRVASLTVRPSRYHIRMMRLRAEPYRMGVGDFLALMVPLWIELDHAAYPAWRAQGP